MKQKLATLPSDIRYNSYRNLLLGIGEVLKESGKKFILYSCDKDLEIVRNLVEQLKEIKNLIKDIKAVNNCNEILGGFIIVSTDNTLSFDLSYNARIELVLRELLPSIYRKLFKEM